jgi:hypothetical protein
MGLHLTRELPVLAAVYICYRTVLSVSRRGFFSKRSLAVWESL